MLSIIGTLWHVRTGRGTSRGSGAGSQYQWCIAPGEVDAAHKAADFEFNRSGHDAVGVAGLARISSIMRVICSASEPSTGLGPSGILDAGRFADQFVQAHRNRLSQIIEGVCGLVGM